MELHNAFSYQLQLNSLLAFQFESIPVIANGSIYFNLVIKNLNSTPIVGIGLGTFAHGAWWPRASKSTAAMCSRLWAWCPCAVR
jgi:hypothetical protein